MIILALLAGCADLPRDPDGTLERVRGSGYIRVGRVEYSARPVRGDDVLQRIEQATGARAPFFESDDFEPLLARLEQGELDLVINGHFDSKSPWKKRVTLSKPLGPGPVAEHIAMRNGENAWVMLVERAVRAEIR